MTEDEAIKKLIQFRDEKIKQSGWWVFNRKQISFARTKLLKPYEKDANLPLPESLLIGKAILDKKGITIDKKLYLWKEILATGITTEYIHYYDHKIHENNYKPDEYLLIYLFVGNIIEVHLGDTRHLYGQLGHFIEQFKQITL
jgi:hypothetical protein